MHGVFKEATLKILEKYKPKIIDAINNLKTVVIACGKHLVIKVKDGIVKIISDGVTVTSDDSPAELTFEGDYVVLIFKDADIDLTNGIRDSKYNKFHVTK